MKQNDYGIYFLPNVDLQSVSLSLQLTIHDTSEPTVARFLRELICRYRYFAKLINDQDRELVGRLARRKWLKNGYT